MTSDDADPPSPAGTDPRDLREPWVRPETGALTPAAMMAYIRARCPWARAHTHRSLAPYLLEETVELMAAIVEDEAANTEDSGARGTGAANAAGAAGAADAAEVADAAGAADAAEVADAAGAADAVEAELADVLYQVLFHAALIDDHRGREPGTTWESLQERVVRKYVRRHPHVFDSAHPVPLVDVQRRYQQVKAEEKEQPDAVCEPSADSHAEAADTAVSILSEIRETMEDRADKTDRYQRHSCRRPVAERR